MLKEKNFFSLLYHGSRQRHQTRHAGYNPQLLNKLLSDYHQSPTRRKTRDLIQTLLSHGARATRANQPRARVALSVYTPGGQKAVTLRMAK